ncbi:enoyl reductase [Dunaliella salina]|uniref:Enoyl reductase n=1 Tax=Dunaliella salina TaxID=3046 RepID=A0ABQ7H0B9_DUNSA|nr:enoyl reductase [Dunaliella salina]|eukprot:KAF5840308.1 enoyl reductase [Dunaliella salina]
MLHHAMQTAQQHIVAKGAMSAAPTMLGISRNSIAGSNRQQSSPASSASSIPAPHISIGSLQTGLSSRQQGTMARRCVQTAAGNGGGLQVDLTGKKVFIAGVADDQGFGWGIAKAMAEAGAEISLGVWVPALNIFESSYKKGKFDESRKLSNGSLMEFKHVFPMDAVFDTLEDVPEEIANNKRYAGNKGWTVSECAERVSKEIGNIDILVHSLANGPEVQKPLLDTSRKGYLAAMSASAYSFVSMMQRFAPIMNPGGSVINLTYIASNRVIPGYGGGMSSAKAALESDTRVLAYEVGRKHNVRVNSISAGPLGSRAAKAIGFIDDMIK